MRYLINIIYYISELYMILMVIRALLSWPMSMSSGRLPGFVRVVYQICFTLTEPLVKHFRKLMSRVNTGNFDFSILAAVMAVYVFQYIAIKLIVWLA